MTRVCFVSETGRADRPIQDPSVRYRCFHPAEALNASGHFATVYSAVQFYTEPSFDYDVYVFHRPNIARPNFVAVTEQLRRHGKTLIADYDDLIFGDPAVALESSAVKNGTLSTERAIAAFANNLEALQQFRMVSVSTSPLADKVQEFSPSADIHVTHNFIPASVLAIHADLQTHLTPRPQTAIGYFAGTKSHNRDFPIVAAALRRVLLENPTFTLMIVGPVELPAALSGLPNISTAPVVNFLRLPGLMTLCNTVIAPLEMGEFNACKSRVKFLEAALAGSRLLASPIPDMRAVGDGRLGLMDSEDSWYRALSTPPQQEDYQAQAMANFAYLQQTSHVDDLISFWSEA